LFWKTLNAYYQKFGGRNAETNDFKNVLESVTGKSWTSFFTRWLYTEGHPVLSKAFSYDAGKKMLTVTITQQQPKLFDFSLVMQITGNESVTKSAHIAQRVSVFNFPMDSPADAVILDPRCQLLFAEK
jgi:aminopeptidase N